jgi:hypothetical protein
MTALIEIPAPMRRAGAEPEFLTASKLKERGWTDALIRKLLGMPDDYAANFVYPGGAPVRLYRLDRVVEIEASIEFREAKEKSTKRQAASVKAMDTKRETALKWLAALDGPKLPPAPRAEITRLAVNWFNEAHAWRGDCQRWFTGNESENYLAAIVVDYVIHQLHDYETKLQRAIGKVPHADDLAIIRAKILDAIGAAFPWLASECEARKGHEAKRD